MKILDKVKGLFFEEVEYTSTNLFPEKDEDLENTEIKEQRAFFKNAFSKDMDKNSLNSEEVEEKPKPKDEMEDVVSERDLFKNDSTFKFPIFDEEEDLFSDMKEPDKSLEPIIDYTPPPPKPSYRPLVEPLRPKEKKPFKPSPVISPVYGIVSGEKPEPTPKKEDIKLSPKKRSSLTFDTIREKAYGNLEHDLETTIIKGEKDIFYNLREEVEEEEVNLLYDFVSTNEDLSDITIEEAKESYEYRGVPFDNDKFKEDIAAEELVDETVTEEEEK